MDGDGKINPNNNNQILIPFIQKYLPIEDLKQIRLVNKFAYSSVQNSQEFQNHITYHINGQHPFTTPSMLEGRIEHLVNSPVQWTCFKFSNFNLENHFFGKEMYFEPFVTNYSQSLKSLVLDNCGLRMGRLIEFVTFCTALEQLEIRNCPLLFSTSLDILNWASFIPHFHHRLRKLTSECINVETYKSL